MSANWALQSAIKTALSSNSAVKALIGTTLRLYQDVPDRPQFPYAVFGDTTDVPSLAECVDGWEIFVPINIYSRPTPGGFEEAKEIGAAIDAVLHNADLTLATGYRCVLIERDSPTRYIKAPDNLTVHGLVTFRAEVEPTA